MAEEQPSLFDAPLYRSTDNRFSVAAGEQVRPKIGRIQWAVINAYRRHGNMRARQCEKLPELGEWGYSTVRKRVSELYQAGVLEYEPRTKDGTYQLNEFRVRFPLPPEPLPVCPCCHRVIPKPKGDPA